jgi:hypothetical protein
MNKIYTQAEMTAVIDGQLESILRDFARPWRIKTAEDKKAKIAKLVYMIVHHGNDDIRNLMLTVLLRKNIDSELRVELEKYAILIGENND